MPLRPCRRRCSQRASLAGRASPAGRAHGRPRPRRPREHRAPPAPAAAVTGLAAPARARGTPPRPAAAPATRARVGAPSPAADALTHGRRTPPRTSRGRRAPPSRCATRGHRPVRAAAGAGVGVDLAPSGRGCFAQARARRDPDGRPPGRVRGSPSPTAQPPRKLARAGAGHARPELLRAQGWGPYGLKPTPPPLPSCLPAFCVSCRNVLGEREGKERVRRRAGGRWHSRRLRAGALQTSEV